MRKIAFIALIIGSLFYLQEAYAESLKVEEKEDNLYIHIPTNDAKAYQASLDGHWVTIALPDELFYALQREGLKTTLIQDVMRGPDPRYGVIHLLEDAYFELHRTFSDHKVTIEISNKSAKIAKRYKALAALPVPHVKPDFSDRESIPEVHIADTKPLGAPWDDVIDFPWFRNIPAAAFERAGYVWVVFDEWKEINPRYFFQHYPNLISSVEQVPHSKKTVLRMRLSKPYGIKMTREVVTWRLQLFTDNSYAKPKLEPKQTEEQYGSYVAFDIEKIGEPIHVTDPLIGDEIVIVPFFLEEAGHSKHRRFVDFTILSSAQGMAVVPQNNGVKVESLKDRIEITTPSYSQAIPMLVPQRKQVEALPILFDFVKWQGDEATMYDRSLDIQDNIIYAKGSEKAEHQITLAELYIGNQLYIESLGVLETIDLSILRDERKRYVTLLKAVAHFLFGNKGQAHEHFEEIPLESIPEALREELDFWKAAVMATNGWTRQAYVSKRFDVAKARGGFFSDYPDHIERFFSLIDLRSRIEQQDTNQAQKILEMIERTHLDEYSKNELDYFQAIIFMKEGHEDEGMQILERLKGDILDRYNRTRASFVMTQYRWNKGAISTNEAIKEIEPLTVSWRGDALEVNILKYLGKLYILNDQYVEGLRSWRYVVSNLQDSGDALMIASQMSQVFMDIFTTHEKKEITDFEALALYYEFRELTPVGRRGDTIMSHLAQRLIGMDLLDRAEGLLDYQVKHRLYGKEKDKTVNWLAYVCLENNKPDKALDLLEGAREPLDSKLQRDRHYLYIQTLIRASQFPKAYSMLVADKSKHGKSLRVECLWRSESWQELSSFLTMELHPVLETGKDIKSTDITRLKQLIVAQAMLKNKHALERLHEQLVDRLPEKEPVRHILQFFSSANEDINPQDLTTTLGIEFIETFLEYYRSEIQKETI